MIREASSSRWVFQPSGLRVQMPRLLSSSKPCHTRYWRAHCTWLWKRLAPDLMMASVIWGGRRNSRAIQREASCGFAEPPSARRQSSKGPIQRVNSACPFFCLAMPTLRAMACNVLAASLAWQCRRASPSPQPSPPSEAWGRGRRVRGFPESRIPNPESRIPNPESRFLLADRQQRRVAAGRGGVDGERALAGEAQQVVRAAGLGAGAGKALAAERLHADHRADLVAVDVAVADAGVAADVFHGVVDAAVHAQREAVAGGVDLLDHLGQLA